MRSTDRTLTKQTMGRVRRWTSTKQRSMMLVTGMIDSDARMFPPRNRVYGTTIRDKGITGEHERWADRSHTMSCELELVAGRRCDPPGCATSANP